MEWQSSLQSFNKSLMLPIAWSHSLAFSNIPLSTLASKGLVIKLLTHIYHSSADKKSTASGSHPSIVWQMSPAHLCVPALIPFRSLVPFNGPAYCGCSFCRNLKLCDSDLSNYLKMSRLANALLYNRIWSCSLNGELFTPT